MSRRPRGDRGSVTAELAVGLPAVVVLLVAVLAVAAAGVIHLSCADAARAGARAAALGEDDDAVRGVVGRILRGAQVRVSRADGWVTVVVSDGVDVPGGEALTATATAVAMVEP